MIARNEVERRDSEKDMNIGVNFVCLSLAVYQDILSFLK